MSRKNRQTLKESFKQGRKPTEQDFENLIDSTMNILDDGFSKSPESGVGLAPLLEKGTVMSIFQEASDQKPKWEIAIDQKNGNLEIRRFEDIESVPLLSLCPDGSIKLGEENKQSEFNCGIQMPVREGSLYQGAVPANGVWHDITGALEGVQALEVVAVAGKRYTGKHAVLVATATICFGAKGKIAKTSSYYGVYGYKISIRWKKNKSGKNKTGVLQLKTLFKYGEDIYIHYHITSLWNRNLIY